MISGGLALFVPNAWFHFLTKSRKCEKFTKKQAPAVKWNQAIPTGAANFAGPCAKLAMSPANRFHDKSVMKGPCGGRRAAVDYCTGRL